MVEGDVPVRLPNGSPILLSVNFGWKYICFVYYITYLTFYD